MNSKFKLIADATVGVKTDAGIEQFALTDLDSLDQGAEIRIETTSPFDGYFYAVLLDRNDDGVTVAFPVGDSLSPVSAGQAVVVDWIKTPVAGQLRLVVSSTPVSPSDWPTLRGRDGNASHTTGCTNEPSDALSTDG